ncbi:glycosyltransferase family 2 protein [Candidatus Woesearchaeota archaeon]|nr:glycosyltransferase family 2 protein [Candidatus Woesearchaeota archaeon]
MNTPKISVVIPVHNEEMTIGKSINDYYNEFKGKIDFEIIIAEDGSTDNTRHILKRMKREMPLVLFMSSKRKGYQKAIIDVIKHAKYEWIFLVDSDYQFAPPDFWKLYEHTGIYDIILGRKLKRKDPFHRIILSRGFNILARVMFPRLRLYDTDTGFRLFKKSAVEDILPSIGRLMFFTSEFVIRAKYKGYKILEVPVRHFKRFDGKTNVFPLKSIPKIVLHELMGLIRLRMDINKRQKIVKAQ